MAEQNNANIFNLRNVILSSMYNIKGVVPRNFHYLIKVITYEGTFVLRSLIKKN